MSLQKSNKKIKKRINDKYITSNNTGNLSDNECNNLNKEIDNKICHVFNSSNILITREDIDKILKKANIEHNINDLSLFQTAFIHDSYYIHGKRYKNIIYEEKPSDEMKDHVLPLQDTSYERLEWFGDSIIQSVVARYIWNRYDSLDPGMMTKLRSRLVKTEPLSKFAIYLGLKKYIIISKYVEDEGNGRNAPHILEDVFEALCGALFLDAEKNNENAYGKVEKLLVHVIENNIDMAELICYDDNYKDQLMRYYHQNFESHIPRYSEYISDDYDKIINKKICKMRVFHPDGRVIGVGTARIKKDAEQAAAKEALRFFGLSVF